MSNDVSPSRRTFLKTTALAGGTLALGLGGAVAPRHVHAGESSQIRIGLIGCGGRGCGAVADALSVDPNVKLTALGDVFQEKAELAARTLGDNFGERIDVKDRIFSGFDCYKSVIEACDVPLLCTPQHFRPMTLRAAIEASKHVFCEKPVAVDAPGIRSVIESCKIAREKKLNVVSGLVNRYSTGVQEMVKRVHDGAIGEVAAAQANRMGGPLWERPRVEGDTELKYQMRNWVNYNWISAGFMNDVTIHQIDVAMWCLGDEIAPVAAYGLGSQYVRTQQPGCGDIFDTLAVVYEYADGRTLSAFSRQIPKCFSGAESIIYGSKGQAMIGNVGSHGKITGPGAYVQTRVKEAATQLEHKALYDAIRSGGSTYVNNGDYMVKATLACLLGNKVCETGQRTTWEEMLASEESFSLPEYRWDATPPTLPNEQGRYKLYYPGVGCEYPS